eukprot:TRINITY_DN5292_c0_g1_i4.p1 TRINITY_DN5292_c0_g1~~TRINITY_DN5292_c0_g1_i4.p1  ORF type:complete len:393 (-),score=73.65 TRINITY_DN5292_c0_g1_i4:7-1185(-)
MTSTSAGGVVSPIPLSASAKFLIVKGMGDTTPPADVEVIPTASLPSANSPMSVSSTRSFYREALHQMFAGAISGACSAVATAPLDLAKTRMQVEYAPKVSQSAGGRKLKYNGLFMTLNTTFKEEGFKGWFRGLGSCLLGLVPSWTIYFTCYNSFKRILIESDTLERLIRSNNSSSNFAEERALTEDENPTSAKWRYHHPAKNALTNSESHMLAAMGAGMINATLTNPLWVVKVRMQTTSSLDSKTKYSTIPGTFRTIIKEEGVSGLFKGLPVSLFGTIHVVIQFPLYEYLKERRKPNQSDLNLGDILIASIASKLVATSITYPHELLRARFQRQRVKRYHNIGDALVKIFREEGPKAFYRGMGTNLIRVIPTCAITFTVYEYALKFINSVDP